MDPAKVNKICFLHDNIQFLIDTETEQQNEQMSDLWMIETKDADRYIGLSTLK